MVAERSFSQENPIGVFFGKMSDEHGPVNLEIF